MTEAQYFKVKNWEKFQHYQTGKRAAGTPNWIKLYASVLDDYAFSCLPDASKAHLIAIWLVAARTNNRIPWDEKWLAIKISAKSKLDLQTLLKSGFIEMLAGNSMPSYQDASEVLAQKRREEEEKREEKETYGEFGKVHLFKKEHQKLVDRFGEAVTKAKVDELDRYIASKGKKYQDHYATILAWEGKNKTQKIISPSTPTPKPFTPRPNPVLAEFGQLKKEKEERVAQ